MTRLERFRANRDTFFQTHEHSPLLPEQRERFIALRYYPEDPALRFVVELEPDTDGQPPIVVVTSETESTTYSPAGRIQVVIAEEPVTLTVYRDQTRGRYFLPFRDATAGPETYGAGRYLDPQQRPDGKLIIDFNYAYNPYRAYNDQWTCLIPPMENRVQFPIRAGEQDFADGH